MSGWSQHKGHAVALPIHNVDTDQLIPSRFMSTPRSEGYGRFLLHDLRRDTAREIRPDFPLNRHDHASILVAGRNFGSGSSREAAVYALVDAGIRAVFAPSFGDIFASNAINNGLLPARIREEELNLLFQALAYEALSAEICLEKSSLLIGDQLIGFDLDSGWRTKLINGWDDIDLTLAHKSDIDRHKQNLMQRAPWALPAQMTKSS
ncbi:3-isopropylmalate dehydratase small subunit [Labrenzia sp. PHM005]|uniref:3-isopropylmalate dehydratase small subunit n=1 Tax=Stappiaceae TaxID=2821832 RepID=UPI00113FFAC6|nr:3-isopropylmalate dehydratase small subunit [Labrenzia sp. PHM005]QDG78914.1 3-isopropylmalate dehydratase small subunit [Labrenzia sp. PHM005]